MSATLNATQLAAIEKARAIVYSGDHGVWIPAFPLDRVEFHTFVMYFFAQKKQRVYVYDCYWREVSPSDNDNEAWIDLGVLICRNKLNMGFLACFALG